MEWLIVFACTLLSFHASEFALQVRFNRSEVSWDTLLLSWPYARSMAAAAVENAIRRTIAPVWATEMLRAGPLPAVLCAVRVAGVALVVVGEGVRKAGILTAGRHFTHDIKQHRRRGHVLVTNGIYRYMRHPGYAGFFAWAVGTQLMLLNPACTVMFAVVTWMFFNQRIAYEDGLLRGFFGEAYADYRRRTPSGLPFIP